LFFLGRGMLGVGGGQATNRRQAFGSGSAHNPHPSPPRGEGENYFSRTKLKRWLPRSRLTVATGHELLADGFPITTYYVLRTANASPLGGGGCEATGGGLLECGKQGVGGGMWKVGPPRFGRRAFGFIANNPHPSPPPGEGVDLRRPSQGAALGTCYGSVAVGGFTASCLLQATSLFRYHEPRTEHRGPSACPDLIEGQAVREVGVWSLPTGLHRSY